MPEPNNKIYLETTALIDHVLKGWYPELKEILDSSNHKTTSQYSCMEIKKGFLQNWILLYNKAIQYNSFHKISQFISNLSRSPKRYYLGACVDAVTLFENEYSKRMPIDLAELYGKANEGEIRLEKFKSILRTQIKRCFHKIKNSSDEVYNPMECFKDISEPKLENEMFYNHPDKCDSSQTKCNIKDFIKDNTDAFQKILEKLESLDNNKDDETKRRIISLKELLKNIRLNRNFDNTEPNQKHCWNISDAILAVIPKTDETIITSNLIHFEPICEAIGKSVKGYKSTLS
jgi:hypothetical protein